jgi:hypothetical protein
MAQMVTKAMDRHTDDAIVVITLSGATLLVCLSLLLAL